MQAAYRLVKKHGYSNIGIRDIVREAEVSIGSFYAYYKDKSDIGLEVVRQISEEFFGKLAQDIIRDLPKTEDFETIVYLLLLKMKENIQKNRKLHKEFALLSYTDDNIRKAIQTVEVERTRIEVSKLLKHYGQVLEIDADEAQLIVAHRAMDDIIGHLVFFGSELSEERILKETAKMIARYLTKK